MRIAFLTSEFVTEYPNGGGLGNYLNKMSRLLAEQHHEVEIFVPSDRTPRVLMHEQVRVERVYPLSDRLSERAAKVFSRALGLSNTFACWAQARALAVALERRHAQAPFDIVQSSDYLAVGLCLRRRKGRVHLVRCSTAADLYNKADGRNSWDSLCREKIERNVLRRANCAYAPSRFIADHFRTKYRIDVKVVRPPLAVDVAPSGNVPCGLPDRFLIYFGQLAPRKGTEWLSKALRCACEIEPGLRMLWIGRAYNNEFDSIQESLGPYCCNVQLRYPLLKPELYAILQRADAAVVPSLVDNLPNTVIESLMFGIPVIGTRGASIDELVEHGVTGELVPEGDVEALCGALVRMWRKQSPVPKGFRWQGQIVHDMQPQQAVENFVSLASAGPAGTADRLPAYVYQNGK
jgi:glycosyltransferase involved in cell wall biosynthesis